MCPASDAAVIMPRARMVFAGRVQIKAACSKALCCTLVLPIPSHDRCAKRLLALPRSDDLATAGDAAPGTRKGLSDAITGITAQAVAKTPTGYLLFGVSNGDPAMFYSATVNTRGVITADEFETQKAHLLGS